MPGLVPGIHVSASVEKDVEALRFRIKPYA